MRQIVITGFMAAGKTTLAGILAQRLNRAAIDLDSVIIEREGLSVASLIREKGETDFRKIETRALQAALENEMAQVIALGGGTWTIAENRDLIASPNVVSIWIDTPFELCWQRIQSSSDARPLAQEKDDTRKLYENRRALYALADLRVSANDLTLEVVVNALIKAIGPISASKVRTLNERIRAKETKGTH